MKLIVKGIRCQSNEGKIEIVITPVANSLQVQQEVSDMRRIVAQGKELAVEIKQHRKQRSLDANSYCWVLVGKIAEVIRSSAQEVYIDMLNKYGQAEKDLVSVVEEAGDMIRRATNGHCTEVGTGEVKGKKFVHFRILIGSSNYDSHQMATLIDGIVSDAKELGIETMGENERRSMLGQWKGLGDVC